MAEAGALARVNCSIGEVSRDYSGAFKRSLVSGVLFRNEAEAAEARMFGATSSADE